MSALLVLAQVPAMVGAVVCVCTVLVILVVMGMGGDDDAPAPAPAPVPTPAPPTEPAPLGPSPQCTPSCANGGTCTAGGTCTCTGDIDGTGPLASVWLDGALWEGESCENRPACSFCGAQPYCGLDAVCDPDTPPEPVVAVLSFGSNIDGADIAPGSPERAQFEDAFATDVSSALNIPAESIVVISIDGGSIVVEFAILPDSNFQAVDGADGQYAFIPEAKLAELSSKVTDPGLFATLGEVADVGEVVSAPAVVSAPDNEVMCTLKLRRLDACNGKMSVEEVCADRNCIVAMELAAAADECGDYEGFDTLPDATRLGCTADGGVGAVDTMPDQLSDATGCFGTATPTAAAMNEFSADVGFDTFSLTTVGPTATPGATLEGDTYVVPGFGAHFDGDGDRVSLSTGTSYGTDNPFLNSDGPGFAIAFWFTKEVCNAEQDRWEVLYQHTNNEADPVDLFRDATPAQCVEIADDSVAVDAEACAAVAEVSEATCSAVMTAADDQVSACEYRAARGTTSGLTMAIGCATQRSRSTAGGDFIRVAIKDDDGVNPQFDWQLGCAGSDPGLQGTWIHFVLSVHPESLRVYADGVEQTMFGFPRSWRNVAGASIMNPAYPSPRRLSETLGTISLEGQAALGSFQGDLGAQSFHASYTGRMAYVQIFSQAISEADSLCLFTVPDLVEGCPDDSPASSLNEPLTEATDGVTLGGDTSFHAEFGLKFDGSGDWAEITPTTDYTAGQDGSFTINFWVSQTLCKIPGYIEPLFSHRTNTTGLTADEAAQMSSIGISVTCWTAERGTGPSFRARVISKSADATGARAGLTASGPNMLQASGWQSSNWISVGLSVTQSSMMLYLDGMAVETTAERIFGRFANGWVNKEGSAEDLAGTNQANPDPSSFGTPLSVFHGLVGSAELSQPIMLGGIPEYDLFFEGNIQALTIFDDALDMYGHDCLFQELEATVATCAEPGQPTWSRAGRVNNYYASFLDAEVPEGTTLMGDTFQNGAFGLAFDGDEDYVLVSGDTRDFANDGTFAIAFWFTKPVCNVPGRWEFVFSQLEDPNLPVTWPGNSGVDMFIGCGERFQVSSVGGDILRTVLVDRRRHRAMFDVQIDYFGGGIMTDSWVHVVMNVHRASGCGLGRRTVAAGGIGGRRRMQAEMASGGDTCTGSQPSPWDSMTPEERAAARNRFGGVGEVCDMGGAEVFINGELLPRDAMGYPCDPQNPCDGSGPGFQELFSEGPVSRLPSQFQDTIQLIALGGDDPRAMMPLLLGSGALSPTGAPQRPGGRRPSVGDGDSQPVVQQQNGRGDRGGRDESGNVTAAGGRRGTNRTNGARDRAMNVAVPDPTNFSEPLRGFDSSDVYRDNRAYEIPLNKGGFNRRDNGQPVENPRGNGLSAGTHVFHATLAGNWGFSNGWSGGYWEIVNGDGDLLAGGPVNGLVTDRGGDVDFTIEDPTDYSAASRAGCVCTEPCSNTHRNRGRTRTTETWYCPIQDANVCDMEGVFRSNRLCLVEDLTLRIVTRTNAAAISWSIDDGQMYSGPAKSDIYIGGRAGLVDDHYFVGSLAGLTINSRPLEVHEVECMYLAGTENIGQCDSPASVGFSSSLRGRRVDDPVTTHGHAFLDRHMGATLDGQRDYVTFTDEGYMSRRGQFTISFWFLKKTSCENPGRSQFLYSETALEEARFFRSEGAAVEIWLSCSQDEDNGGDSLRTFLRDDDGQIAAFDINIDQFRSGGPITSQWVHYLLAVNRRSVRLYIDGTPTGISDDPPTELSGRSRGGGDTWRSGRDTGGSPTDDGQQTISFTRWMSNPERNLAFPNPEELNNRLSTFRDFAEVYSARSDQVVPLDGLAPDTTYTINFGHGVDTGAWFVINATRVKGVPESCLPSGHDAAQCMEGPVNGTLSFDNNCCANPTRAGCAPGFSYVQGPSCRAGRPVFSTYCFPDSQPEAERTADCEFTPGDASSCAATCNYEYVAWEGDNLLTQQVGAEPGTATFTTPPAAACVNDNPPCEGSALGETWQPGGIFLSMHSAFDGPSREVAGAIEAEIVWSIDDTDLAGPRQNTVYLGSRTDVADEHFYMGSMQNVMVQTDDVDDTEAFCIFQDGQQDLDVCDTDTANVKVDILGGRNLDSRPRWGLRLGNEAHLEDDYGVTLDGLGDYARLESDDLDYARSGEFAVAFWFTKAVCRSLGDTEILYSHHANPEAGGGCRHDRDTGVCTECNPGVQVSLGCLSDGSDGFTAGSTISGDIIRVEMTDSRCNTAVFDTPLNKAGGGYVTDAWVHFALSTRGGGAHVYIDGEIIRGNECRAKPGPNRRANRQRCRDGLTLPDFEASCNAVLGDDGQPACQFTAGEHGYPVGVGRKARRWRWATSPANAAFPSVRDFQREMGPYVLWQTARAGRRLRTNVTLDAGSHTFKPGCRGCRYSRTGWGDATWTLTGPDGTTVAGGDEAGRVVTQTGIEVCESGNRFSRFSQSACLAAACCRWDSNADLGPPGADTDGNGIADAVEGGGGQCISAVGDGTCSISEDAWVTFNVDTDDTEMTVHLDLPRNMRNTWVVEWIIDDGGYGRQGPIRGPLFLGQYSDDEDRYSAQGYAGSIAGVKTWRGALRPEVAKCIFQEAETAVGICEGVENVIYEAEFTAGGQASNDPERDLNGPVTRLDSSTIQECLEICSDFKYFGLQWGASCQCGNEYGQHGPAPDQDECNWPCGGNHDDSCRAIDEYVCSQVELDGTEATCTSAGACDWTEASDAVVEAATCTSTSAAYCAGVDLTDEWIYVLCSEDGAPDFDIPGGCAIVANATHPVAGCSAIVTDEICSALSDSETECADNSGCTFTPAVTQAEACVATAKVACESAAVNEDEFEAGADADADADRATCENAMLDANSDTMCLYTPELQDNCGAADRNSIYEVALGADENPTAEYVGCFIDASSDDYLELFGDAYQDQGTNWVGGVEAGFGLTFDGEGDYAMLTRTEGYTADGTFTIAFWFTKTPCNDPEQPYEMLYSHMNYEGDFRSPHIFIQLGCAHSNVHSTAGSGDIIRIAMTDDASRRYLWDTPLVNAAGGGFVTSMWIHFALAVGRTGARVFLDGVDMSDAFGHPEPTNRWVRFAQTYENLAWPDPQNFQPGIAPGPLGYRAMAGKRMDIGNHPNISVAVATCSAFCLSEEGGSYRYMGLQWETECYCDNAYDGRRLGRAVNDDGSSQCGDTEDHPLPICATDEWQEHTCGYANAVFDALNQSNYLGCWKDGPQGVPTGDQWGWGGMTMTMDRGYGDGGDDAGEYYENVTLASGSGSQGGRHYALHKMGTSSGWSEGTYVEVWQDVVANDAQPETCVPRQGFDGPCDAPVDGACSPESTYVNPTPRCPPQRCPPSGSIPDCSYQAAREAVLGGLTRLTQGGYNAASCTGPANCSSVDINRRRNRAERRCTSYDGDSNDEPDGCVYTPSTCPDGCLASHEDEWIGFDTIADGTEGGVANIVVKIVTTRWGNGVSWEIANMDLPWMRTPSGFERRTVLALGPARGHPTLGSTGGNGWYSHQEYTGSIGSVGIYWRPLDDEAIQCLYQKTQNILTVCVPPEDMSARPFYTTMNPHDLSGDTTDIAYERATVDSCAEYCYDYQYFGMEWGGRCSCGNSYGSYGAVDEDQCEFDCGGDPGDSGHCVWDDAQCSDAYQLDGDGDDETDSCHQSEASCLACEGTTSWCAPVVKPMCGGRGVNSVYEQIRDGRGWTEWMLPAPVADQPMGYVSCEDATFSTPENPISTPGQRQQCQCMGLGGTVSSTADERRNDEDGGNRRRPQGGDFICIGPDGGPGMVRYGSPQIEYKGCFQDRFRDQDGIEMYGNTYVDDDYGMTFDGEGDYARVDMERNAKWLTNDGTFTIAFWVTKTACTAPGWWEPLISYYKYPDMRKRDPRNSHLAIWMGCASYAESTIEGADIMRLDYLDDDGWKAAGDFNMNSDMLDGPTSRATNDWVHAVLSIANEKFSVYIDGKDPCPSRRDGRPGRRRSCPNLGLPAPSRWMPWAQTPCTDDGSKECNTLMGAGATTGMKMRYSECKVCQDAAPGSDNNPFGDYGCSRAIPYLLQDTTRIDRHPWFNVSDYPENPQDALCGMQIPDGPDGMTFYDICPVTCGICEEGTLMTPGCDVTNSSSPGAGPRVWSDLFIGGAPWSTRRFFTGSINGLGLFRYPLTQQEAACLFHFGEFDVHVCPEVEDMNGLFHSMTFLPVEPDFDVSLPRGGGRCGRSIRDCFVPAVEEACVPAAHDPAACMESASRTINGTDLVFDENCCAIPTEGGCVAGFTFVQGDSVCWRGSDSGMVAFDTYCIPEGTPVPDCTMATPGDESNCAVGCDYTAPVPQQQAVTEAVEATCETPPPIIAHCTWGPASCTDDLVATEGDGAACHASAEACLGSCNGAQWCEETPVDLGGVEGCVLDSDGNCPIGCIFTEAVVAGLPVCEDPAAMCSDAVDMGEVEMDRCVYTDDDDPETDGYTPTCTDPMGTPDGKRTCLDYCAALGKPYTGLILDDRCRCGDSYNGGGQASMTECDADHDGEMDCGTFDAEKGWRRNSARSECKARVAVYNTETGEEIGCFRLAQSMPAGLELGGNAYLDDSGRRSDGSRWWDGVGRADDTSFDDFGIHFDGAGDYAQIQGVDNGYAADGTFAISLWVTKPNCQTSGQEEIIYKHGDLGRRRGASIMMMMVCSNDPEHHHSTVQQRRNGRFRDTNLVRVYLKDDDGKQAVFDVSIDRDGGYVTDTWVHLVVAVERDGIRAYVDGRRQWRVGYPIPILHAMNAKTSPWLQVNWGEDPHQKCAEFCAGYQYSGVQKTEYGRRCFCDNELPTFDTEPHCTWDGDCSADIIYGLAEPCHRNQQRCEGPCSQVTDSTWCPATSGVQQASEGRCGVAGSLCGAPVCRDNSWVCTPERLANSHEFPQDAEAMATLCAMDMHSLAGLGQRVQPGSTVSGMCPVLCQMCTPGQNDTNTACRDTIAVTELATRANGDVVVLGYAGCYADVQDAGGRNWMDPEVNAAFPSISDAQLGRFNIDHGYGVGGRREPPHDVYETVVLTTSDPVAGTEHEFHAHGLDREWRNGRPRGGWVGGFWEVTSTDGAVCDAIDVLGECEAAGACSILIDEMASCDPGFAGHTESACVEPMGDGSMGLDEDCCAMEGVGSCAEGYTYVQGPSCGPRDSPAPLYMSYCADPAVETSPVYTECPAVDTENPQETCEATAGCVYTEATQKCGATVLASGAPEVAEQFTRFNITGSGSMSCVADDRGTRDCARIPMDQDTDTNRAACEGAVSTSCTFVPAGDDSTDTCVGDAVAACAAANDEDSCTQAAIATAFGPDSTPGCVFTPADSAVTVHIHTGHWGNYISWEMRDVTTGQVEGFGPDSSPIELGGVKGMDEWRRNAPWDAFVGNIADLLIFSRPNLLDNDAVDCLYRKQQANLGKCRAPESIWGTVFWDTLTDGEWSPERLRFVANNPSMQLWGEARINMGVGLDLRANNEPMAMTGSYYLMDGVSPDHNAPWNVTRILPRLTPEACVARCTQDGYQFAGLMSGDTCICDNSYDMYGEHTPTALEAAAGSDGCTVGTVTERCQPVCSCAVAVEVTEASCVAAGDSCEYTEPKWDCGGRACVGDSTLACGGGFKLAVYDTSAVDAASGYVGCYEDHNANAVGHLRLREGAERYASDGTFSLSFWFTHNHCENTNATGRWEPLYHHSSEDCAECPTQGIDVFMLCDFTTMVGDEEVTGTFIHVMLYDDDGKMATVDIPFGEETQYSIDLNTGTITNAWVHFALTVDGDQMATYIDGVAVTRYGMPRWFAQNNLAAGHLNRRDIRRADGVIQLEDRLSGMTFGAAAAVCINTTDTPAEVVCGLDGRDADNTTITAQGMRGLQADCPETCKVVTDRGVWLGAYMGSWAPSFFNGHIANLGIFRRPLSQTDISCLYKYGEAHLGLP